MNDLIAIRARSILGLARCSLLSTSSLLALLLACGPSNPGQESTGETAATDPTDADPTDADPTEPTPTGGAADCGPCSTIAEGDLSPSGDTRIDGLIVAVDTLRNNVITLEGDFRGQILALAEVYQLPAADVTPALVTTLIAAIEADFAANLDGPFNIDLRPGRCRADAEVAADALRRCETDANCDVPAPATPAPMRCEGTCFGTCAGACDGPLSCVVAAPGASCDGTCDGACVLDSPVACDGLCRGECQGNCSLVDSNGECQGRCDAECVGSCVADTPAPCAGSCGGACLVDQGSVACSPDATCRGACDARCDGECAGTVLPVSSAIDCAATSGCEPQASARGSASVWCAPSQLELHFAVNDGVGPLAVGAFSARTRQLEIRGAAILQGAAQLGALISGQVDSAVVIEPAPVLVVTSALNAAAETIDTITIPEGRRACTATALQAALALLADTTIAASETMQAQAMFSAFLHGDL